MIKYDYTIRRDEADTEVLYVPKDIPKELPNLSSVEAPNSSGKSTLLNLIALAINGLKSDNINVSLKNKMRALLESPHQSLSFELSIQNHDNTLEMICEKEVDSNQIIVYEKKGDVKKPISPEKLEREYNIIYDIPFNPTERIDQLILTIKNTQKDYEKKLNLFRKHINNTITEIKNGKNPEQISLLKENIKAMEKQLLEKNEKLVAKRSYYDTLGKYTYLNCYVELLRQLTNAENELKTLKNKHTSSKRNKTIKSNRYKELLTCAIEKIKRLKDVFNSVTPKLKKMLSKDQEQLIHLWELIDLDRALRELTFDNNNIKRLVPVFKNELSEFIKDDKYLSYYEESEVIGKLISLLESYKTKNIIIPGYGKNVANFIQLLKEESKKQNDNATYYLNIRSMIESLTIINDTSRLLEETIFPKIRELKDDHDIFIEEEYSTSLDDLLIQVKELQIQLASYEKLCIKKDIDVSDQKKIQEKLLEFHSSDGITEYEKSLSDEQLLDKISLLEGEISKEESQLRKDSQLKALKEIELERLESMKPHPYQKKLSYLTQLHQTCFDLEQKMIQYSSYIDNIIGHKKYQQNDEYQKKYFIEVAHYLGRRIGEIRYIDHVYQAENVDIIEGMISTKEGKKIRLTDMGTGQSQSAYLLAQLNASDHRKIIALFDEVAMMDTKSLQPIYRKMKELYDQGKLLVGIVVQKGDQIKIDNIEDLVGGPNGK